jgi:methionyl aminopeptidase
MNREPPGRNDPCWCGSGRKYKKCHLGADQGKASAPRSLLLGLQERDAMRRAGRFNAELMDMVRPHVVPGVTTLALDRLVEEYTRDHGHIPACLGYPNSNRMYPDYPRCSCISRNEVVCHGIPDEQPLLEGDIVNLDLTTIVDGWHGDQSETFLVGEVAPSSRSLVQVAFDCLHLAIDALRPGSRVSEIGKAITKHAGVFGYGVVRDYQGHGIGREFHQEPDVPHVPQKPQGSFVLEPGICFTIEPMINEGTWRVSLDRSDGWTVRTADGKLSAQFEHTILMAEDGPEVLTRTNEGPQRGHRFS